MMKKNEIILASTNRGKISELAAMLAPAGILAHGLDEFPQIGEIEENGASFAENALIKARAVAKETGLVALADDSGLEVDALAGAPGIFSARFGNDLEFLPGENRDQRNTRKLLHLMRDVPEERRACRFVTAMAAVSPDGKELVTQGEWNGQLLFAPRGENGFGYDPVFFDPLLGLAAAELSQAEKNRRSHRGKALKSMLEQLPAFLAMR